VSLPVEQHDALRALAVETGFRPGALARVAIIRLLNDPASLTGGPPGNDLEKFVAELRADPAFAPAADQLAAAFQAVDLEADGNPDAACLIAAVAAICRVRRPLVDRLRALLALVSIEGRVTVTVPRELLR
jgi:hypothetical protein